mmetsp:Transcript_25465/g.33251  ORF Transcript_25465/g.33251 Transcript_25465/m.33251 type:complete len:253 (+) Transcript_25465:102-860(+)|eukprot:CAMPEP_0117759316 /NCGR_PEP_ID=MMETSP0947-20121206/15942_1 /TAXON_ID=44440 /ORGANISM="Chattonella subsalsa, Strain CCMP2191" /LENGTH=252 /DNA_ID=CAMNT_0005579753 /DNA_START=12 /DNA_END=770 /DNA_ORIENTATION=-
MSSSSINVEIRKFLPFLFLCFLFMNQVVALNLNLATKKTSSIKLENLKNEQEYSFNRRNFLSTIAFTSALAITSSKVQAAETKIPTIGLQRNGRLASCPQTGNCLSTSSIKSLEKFSPPWTFESTGESPETAWKNLISAVENDPLLKLEEVDNNKLYLRATAKSAVPPSGLDDVEFLLIPEDKVVTYRSASREVVYLGPIAVSDGGANKNRLDGLRFKLGWGEVAGFQLGDKQKKGLDRLKGSNSPDFMNYY